MGLSCQGISAVLPECHWTDLKGYPPADPRDPLKAFHKINDEHLAVVREEMVVVLGPVEEQVMYLPQSQTRFCIDRESM